MNAVLDYLPLVLDGFSKVKKFEKNLAEITFIICSPGRVYIWKSFGNGQETSDPPKNGSRIFQGLERQRLQRSGRDSGCQGLSKSYFR